MNKTNIYKIQARKKISLINLAELIEYKELFVLLVWRELKVRYKQTILGILWAILQPILTTIVFAIVFSRIVSRETIEIPYPLFVLSGFTFWNFVNSSVNTASISLVYHTQLVTKVYFPRMMIPLSAVGAFFIDLLLTTVVLLGVALFYGIFPTWKWLLIPIFLIFIAVITGSVSLLLAALNVRFRDVKFIVPFFLQVWMFISPIFYSESWMSENLRLLFAINPVFGCLHGFRHILFDTKLDFNILLISIISIVILLVLSLFLFQKLEEDFADLL